MKKLNLLTLILFFLNISVFCQTFLSVNAGYSSLNMDEINNDLEEYQSAPFGTVSTIPGGLFIELSAKYGLGILFIGLSGDYISSSGSYRYKVDGITLYKNVYDISTLEFLALLEYVIKLQNSPLQFFLQGGAGVGFANADRSETTADPYGTLGDEYLTKNAVGGSYFSGRLKGGLQFATESMIFELSLGYRIANAGELRGDFTVYGNTVKGSPILDSNGNALKFDYSGFLATAGITFPL